MKNRCIWVGLLALVLLLLPACGEDQDLPPEQEEGVLIYAALNPVSASLTNTVQSFNKSHEDEGVRIEIRDYSDEGGIERLRVELTLGQIPDIMEMHYYGKNGQTVGASGGDQYCVLPGTYAEAEDEYWMPYRQMAQKGYLEDLWPYIENDPDLGRDGVLLPPLKAAEVNGSLYILFQKVVIFTLTGRESVVGDRTSWTLEDVMDIYAGMPEGSTILRYNMTKRDVFFNLLRFSLDRFVDRETGECTFDSQDFRDLAGFLDSFPDEVGYEDPADAEDEIIQNIKDGRQMLEGMMIVWPSTIAFSDSLWQEHAAFPGYPTADGSSGSFFYPMRNILAMSSSCKHKDVAWEYIRRLIRAQQSRSDPLDAWEDIPVNLHDYELLGWGERKQVDGLVDDPEGLELIYSIRHFTYGPKLTLTQGLTEEDVQRHRELIDHTTQLYWPEDDLTDIVWEVLGAYFAGDRDLDQTVQMLDNRVGLYLKEAM